MKLAITSDRTVSEIQAAFHSVFPHLKLAFFTKAHDAYKDSPAKFMIHDPKATLASAASREISGHDIHIEADMAVKDLERLFESEFGLHVQVFRQSGKTWLETSRTDDLTLAEQETKAIASLDIHQEFVDPLDYREQD